MKNYFLSFTLSNDVLNSTLKLGEALGEFTRPGVLSSVPGETKARRVSTVQAVLAYEKGKNLSSANIAKAYQRLPLLSYAKLADFQKEASLLLTGKLSSQLVFRREKEKGNSVELACKNLFAWLSKDTPHLLLKSAICLAEFEIIDPFGKASHALGVLWMRKILAAYNPAFASLPIEEVLLERKNEYAKNLALAVKEGDSTSFVVYILGLLASSARKAVEENPKPGRKLDANVRRLCLAMRPGSYYSALELIDRLGLKSRDSFRLRYLRPALDFHVVKMSIPDKPNSRNQRYFKI